MRLYKIIDLFAGVGGIRLGFEKASKECGFGIECVFTSEIDQHCHKTYAANFGDKNIFGDITQIDPKSIPNHDILLAGFPCQPFSQAGLKNGFADTRGTLFFNIEQIIKAKRPRMFLLENVKHLRGHDKGRTFNTILSALRDLGYKVNFEVLNAKDFGLPQNRERLFIVGADCNENDFQFPKPTHVMTSVGSILTRSLDKKYTISDKLWAGHQRRKAEHVTKGNGFGYSIFNDNSAYTSTLSARYYKDGSEILIEQPKNKPRKLTPRECARLQGFDDSFIIPVSDTQAYRQFGNSVPVNVIHKIAGNMLMNLDRNKTNTVNNGKLFILQTKTTRKN